MKKLSVAIILLPVLLGVLCTPSCLGVADQTGMGLPSFDPLILEHPPSIIVGTATGTAFIVSSNGFLLTNEHVVGEATEVAVIIGTTEYTAAVVETLPGSDLALLKVNAQGLLAVHLGNSDEVDIGDTVYAVGCPAGICGTVTQGTVANVRVNVPTDRGNTLQETIMVDITTTHGSSGGPLVNSRGEVVGITTSGIEEGSRAIFGFSIPINQAIPLLQRIPGFRVDQMGAQTGELTFQGVHSLIGLRTSFVSAPMRVYLSDLLPEISGYTTGNVTRDVVEFLWITEFGGDQGVGQAHMVVGSGRMGNFTVMVSVSCFDNESDATAAVEHASERFATNNHGTIGSGVISRGAFDLGELQAPFVIGWYIDLKDHRMVFYSPSGPTTPRVESSSGFYSEVTLQLGELVILVQIRWKDMQSAEGDSANLMDEVGQRSWTGECMTYTPYRSSQPRTLICLAEFEAELERVFAAVVEALSVALP